jgi:hypothetical protein
MNKEIFVNNFVTQFLAAYSAEKFYDPDVTVVVMDFPVEKAYQFAHEAYDKFEKFNKSVAWMNTDVYE